MTVHSDIGEGSSGDILSEATRRLVAELQPLKLFLFGSRSRGTSVADSDFDLMAVVEDSNLPRFRRAIAARRVLMGLNASFDILVLTSKEWSRQAASGVAFVNEVAGRGILLYDNTRS